jgi:hypothetical protein
MIANKNINIDLKAYKCEYWVLPQYGDEGDRKTAVVLAKDEAEAGQLVVKSLPNTPAKWESHPYLIAEIHGITSSVKKALFLALKKEFEGDSTIDRARRLKR